MATKRKATGRTRPRCAGGGARLEATRSLDVEALRQIVEILEASDVTRLVWQSGEEKLFIRRGHAPDASVVHAAPVRPRCASAPVHVAPRRCARRGRRGPLPARPRRRGCRAAGEPRRSPATSSPRPFVGTFYRTPAPDQPAVRRGGLGGAQGPGALHRRGDEADERDRGRGGGQGRRDPRRERRSRWSSASRCSASSRRRRALEGGARVFKKVLDRQPRGDRPARHPRVPRAGHRHRGGALHGRRQRAARALRRRGGVHRAAAVQGELPQRPGSCSPRPRSPAPTPSTPATAFSRRTPSSPRSARTARSASSARGRRCMRLMGNKVRAREAAREAGLPLLPGSSGRAEGRRGGRGVRRGDRLPGHPQGGGRRRRARHEDRPRAAARWRRRSPPRRPRRWPRSATATCTSSGTSRSRATSRSRSSPTSTATSSTSASASARCSAGTRS